ncbi:class A beta-lactamase-related serine hydrolase [Clostridium algoriphilum]|uniref:serine hydrolase n=1 Tax=Clostridium algoriphilum TaxID=198347 RepID=UPI001CF48AEC|nr:serine hydrolase [Clostridium algoriphilum]MCB2294544.1 class A beta-lactamase-related serine hydrolase [Clostridium algoriphilum]
MRKNNSIILLAIIAFFIALNISKHKVAAVVDTQAVSHTSLSNKINNVVPINASGTKYLFEYKQDRINQDNKKQAQLDTLEKRIKTLVGDNINNFGMVYYDINSKKSITINEDKQFLAASTIKVPINMLMYDMVKEKKIDINEKLKYDKVDFEDGAGVLQGTDLSKPIAIKTLSDLSIIYSDNIAINMLLRKVGIENRYNYIEKIVGHPITHDGNNITPMDSSKILERLYSNPNNNKYYKDIIKAMKNTEYHDRIDKYIPQKIVAHKIGDFAPYVNDTAIVCNDNPYVLVVFTKGINDADDLIAQVSKMIYDAKK